MTPKPDKPVHPNATSEGEVGPAEQLQAGRELDALIAEKVMHWTLKGAHPIFGSPVYATGKTDTLVPFFSADIGAAWDLKDFLLRNHRCSYFEIRTAGGSYYTAQFSATDLEERISEDGDTAPLAICRMALKTVKEKPDA